VKFPIQILSSLIVLLLAGCAQSNQSSAVVTDVKSVVSEKDVKKITTRNFNMDEPMPPLEEFSVRDTIIHTIDSGNPRVDLQNLRFYNKKVTRSDLIPFSNLNTSHIDALVLADLQLDDKEIEPIKSMKLKSLSLAYNPVRDLHILREMNSISDLCLDYCSLTREGMQAVASRENLKFLRLNGTSISDADLMLLYPLKELKELELNDCKNISKAAIAKLKQALPNCKVNNSHRVKAYHELSLNDLKAIESGLMRNKEFAEADLALQKFISKWKGEKNLPYALLAEAFRLRGECQKALGNLAESQSLMAESAKYGKQVKDLN
jgi:hypothetical protein